MKHIISKKVVAFWGTEEPLIHTFPREEIEERLGLNPRYRKQYNPGDTQTKRSIMPETGFGTNERGSVLPGLGRNAPENRGGYNQLGGHDTEEEAKNVLPGDRYPVNDDGPGFKKVTPKPYGLSPEFFASPQDPLLQYSISEGKGRDSVQVHQMNANHQIAADHLLNMYNEGPIKRRKRSTS